jgi:hypothetical protein
MYYYEPMKKETLTVKTDEYGTVMHYNAEGWLHNPDGPAVVYVNGTQEHWINGELHNEDGPAVADSDGYKFYYINNKLHNPHGPAVIDPDGCAEFWIDNEELTEAEFKSWRKNNALTQINS